MATSSAIIDDLLRDYFVYRNLPSTWRQFEQDSTKFSLGQSHANRIIEQLTLFIHQLDLTNFIDYWTQIEQRLPPVTNEILLRIRLDLYRCYLIHAVQSSKTEKINEFYERLNKILQQSNRWSKEWFALPFISNPDEDEYFRVFFSKEWNEMFWHSLQNFLAMMIYQIDLPKIGTVDSNDSSAFASEHSIGPNNASLTPSSSANILSKLRSKFLNDSTVTKDKVAQ